MKIQNTKNRARNKKQEKCKAFFIITNMLLSLFAFAFLISLASEGVSGQDVTLEEVGDSKGSVKEVGGVKLPSPPATTPEPVRLTIETDHWADWEKEKAALNLDAKIKAKEDILKARKGEMTRDEIKAEQIEIDELKKEKAELEKTGGGSVAAGPGAVPRDEE